MFEKMKNDILGKRYSLSVALVPAKKSREINKLYRGKDKPANVLSFPYSKTEGEIVLCPSAIRKDIKKFDRKYDDLLRFMVIHGMLHLKGMRHGSRMEEEESRYDQKYLHRNRSGIRPSKGGDRRVRKGR